MNAAAEIRGANLPDDATLVSRIAAGEVNAFEPLMRRYNQRLYRVARATLRNDADAEDALQDAYLLAYRSIGKFRGESSLSTWLTRIVLNECLVRIRRTARRQNVIPLTGASDDEINQVPAPASERPDAAAMRTEMRALLERNLDMLPEALRIVFVLRAVEDLSVEEVAQCLGIPQATVRSRHFRARSLLRDALAREIDSSERDVFAFAGSRCDRIVAGVMAMLRNERP